jgi:hypothetical protein
MTSPLGRTALWTLAGILAISLLLPFGSGAVSPSFNPPNPGAPPESWAYGTAAGATATSTGTLSSGYSYQVNSHAFLSWNVIFTQTNTSSTSFTINATRTVGASLFVEGCVPNCNTPVAQINLTATAVEIDHAWANFTTAGTVLVNGTTSVPAVALENEGITVFGNVSGQANWQVQSIGGQPATSGNAYLAAQVNADASADFTPALGLFPMSPTVGQNWTSSSNYTALGTYTESCHAYDSSVGEASCNSGGSLQGSGTVTLWGLDSGWGVVINGHLYPFHVLAVSLHSRGTYTFDAVDGLFLLPHASDLLSGSASSSSSASASAGVSTSAVDFAPGSAHFGPTAAKGQFAASVDTSDISASAGSLGGVEGSLASIAPAAASGNANIQPLDAQAAPESVGEAQAADTCITSGIGCSSPASPSPISHLGALVFLVAVVVVVGVVALLVARRRSAKPPVSPTGVTIPSGGFSPGAPAPPPSGNPNGTPTDPLGNLW